MKRILFLVLCFLFLIYTPAWSAGTVTGQDDLIQVGPGVYQIIMQCTGDPSDGSIPDTIINPPELRKLGLYLYRVIIDNKAVKTSVTDNSDVYIKDSGGSDLLSGEGVDQLDDDTRNYIQLMEYEPILGALTLDVNNQATASGEYEITLILVK